MTMTTTTQQVHFGFAVEYGLDHGWFSGDEDGLTYDEYWVRELARMIEHFAAADADVLTAVRAGHVTDTVAPNGRTLRMVEIDCLRDIYPEVDGDDRVVAMFVASSAAWKKNVSFLESFVRERAAAWQRNSQYTADDVELNVTVYPQPSRFTFVLANLSVVQRDR